VGTNFQAHSIGEHSRQQGFAGAVDLLHVAEVDLQPSLTPGCFPATFDFRHVVRRKCSAKNESSSAAIAKGFNSKHDKLSVGTLTGAVGDLDHLMECRSIRFFALASLHGRKSPLAKAFGENPLYTSCLATLLRP
jgi:hypothetical protein